MTEHDALVFLASLAVLLAGARGLGEVARWAGMPLIVGEIGAGILLGPTALGKLAPGVRAWLFPSGAPQTMVGAYTSVAAVLLLVVAGLEVDLSVVWRRGRSALYTSVLGILAPMACGYALGWFLPDSDLVDPNRRVLFATFLGVALSISALPVIAKTLLDIGLFKTEMGLLVMAAAMIADLVGWICFAVLVGPLQGREVDTMRALGTIGLAVVFVAVCLALGRPVLTRVFARIEAVPGAAPGRLLSVVILMALFGAAATQAIGVHAVLGGFVVGVMVGDSGRLKTRTRVVIEDFVMNVFAPVFFASLGLRVDFGHAFDLRLCVLVLVVASVAKLVGCAVGARLGGMAWRQSMAIGFGLNARGAMEIILALIALDAGLIREQLFVALVVMALVTSLTSGPMLKRLLYKGQPEEEVVLLLREGAFIPELKAMNPPDAIHELVRVLGSVIAGVKRDAREAVLERERVAPTGLGDEVAIPHAAVEGLTKPVLALGIAKHGIDFDAPDGKPAKIVFLLLMPPRAYEREVRILASIARAVFDVDAREKLMHAEGPVAAADALAKNAERQMRSTRPPARSLSSL